MFRNWNLHLRVLVPENVRYVVNVYSCCIFAKLFPSQVNSFYGTTTLLRTKEGSKISSYQKQRFFRITQKHFYKQLIIMMTLAVD